MCIRLKFVKTALLFYKRASLRLSSMKSFVVTHLIRSSMKYINSKGYPTVSSNLNNRALKSFLAVSLLARISQILFHHVSPPTLGLPLAFGRSPPLPPLKIGGNNVLIYESGLVLPRRNWPIWEERVRHGIPGHLHSGSVADGGRTSSPRVHPGPCQPL